MDLKEVAYSGPEGIKVRGHDKLGGKFVPLYKC